jgi:Xaa-Pro aminopeptidase
VPATEGRRHALAASLPGDVDAMLVTNLVNVRYLTGFTGSHGAVLVTRTGDDVFATDGRYDTQARAEVGDLRIEIARGLGPELVRLAGAAGVRRLGVEGSVVSLTAHQALAAAGGDDIEIVDVGQPVEPLRVVKDETELTSLREACRVTDEVFAAVLTELRPGVTERDIAWAMRREMHVRGTEPAFDSIVAFGPHSAIPHHQPTDRPLERGNLVKLDFGARVDGYHADMTRTVVVGPASDWQRELHGLVREVQQAGRAAAVPGAVPVELDADVRGRIEAAGHEFPHGLGHGVGLEIHESPFVVPESRAATLVERVPVTIEPGVYLPGRGGVRIEDTVLVRTGGADSLTLSPRDLIEI